MTVVQAMIKPQYGVLLMALWALGYVLKKSKLPDEFIPAALCIFAIVGACGVNGSINAEAIFQGILCAAMSVSGHQVLHQANKKVTSELNKMTDH